MNTEDPSAAERRVAAWMTESAPVPATDLAARLLERTRTVPQRTRGGIMDMFVVRAVGVAAVVAAAVVVGFGISRVIGPPEAVGSAPPAEASPSSSAISVPSASSTPPSESATSTSSPPAPEPGRIAFQANRDNETSGIYLMDTDGSNVVPLVDDPSIHEMDPVWSPNGSWIAYTTMSADGSLAGGVFMVDVSGGDPVQVDDNFAYSPAVWSPDGSMLAVGGDGSSRGIGVYDVDEQRMVRLTEDGGTAPQWSPDGTRIAYNVALPNDIRIVDVASGDVRNVTDDPWNDSVARWTDGGTRLVFVSDRDTDQTKDSQQSWVVDLDGGEAELLGEPVLAIAHWPSPDGEWLAYASDEGGELRLSRADGSEDRAVHPTSPADQGPSWASDSSAFVFSNAHDAPRDIFLMRVDADGPERLTDAPADESAPNWGPPGA